MSSKFTRILVKLSGEALLGNSDYGIDPAVLKRIAGELQDMEELLEHDPQLKARAPLVTLEHPLLGPFGHVRTPLRFSRSPVVPYRAPGMGEHSAIIATELAGLSPERVNELEKLGVFQ